MVISISLIIDNLAMNYRSLARTVFPDDAVYCIVALQQRGHPPGYVLEDIHQIARPENVTHTRKVENKSPSAWHLQIRTRFEKDEYDIYHTLN